MCQHQGVRKNNFTTPKSSWTAPLKTLLIVNFVVEALSGLCLMIIPAQAAEILYPKLEANVLALKFARTSGTAIFVLGLLSILPLMDRFRPSLSLILVILSVYHLLATAHNAYLLVEGVGSSLPTAIHAILVTGFAVYSARLSCPGESFRPV